MGLFSQPSVVLRATCVARSAGVGSVGAKGRSSSTTSTVPAPLMNPTALAVMRTVSNALVTALSSTVKLNLRFNCPAKFVTNAGTVSSSGWFDCKAMMTLVRGCAAKSTVPALVSVPCPSVTSDGSVTVSCRFSLSLTRITSKSPVQFTTEASMTTFTVPSRTALSTSTRLNGAEFCPAGMTTVGATSTRLVLSESKFTVMGFTAVTLAVTVPAPMSTPPSGPVETTLSVRLADCTSCTSVEALTVAPLVNSALRVTRCEPSAKPSSSASKLKFADVLPAGTNTGSKITISFVSLEASVMNTSFVSGTLRSSVPRTEPSPSFTLGGRTSVAVATHGP